jgi:hypothetical protein
VVKALTSSVERLEKLDSRKLDPKQAEGLRKHLLQLSDSVKGVAVSLGGNPSSPDQSNTDAEFEKIVGGLDWPEERRLPGLIFYLKDDAGLGHHVAIKYGDSSDVRIEIKNQQGEVVPRLDPESMRVIDSVAETVAKRARRQHFSAWGTPRLATEPHSGGRRKFVVVRPSSTSSSDAKPAEQDAVER